MPPFLYAAELKKSYRCFGHFYELKLTDATVLKCRSVLEIINDKQVAQNDDTLSARKPDAVVIMMNPGSSRPLLDDYREPQISCPQDELDRDTRPLVLTMPDTTQYQVMRVMHALNWSHVRVLNLSDLREAKSHNFVKRVAELSKKKDGDLHSIFCETRRNELVRLIRGANAGPVILAWGKVQGLKPLARQCLDAVASKKTVGVSYEDDACLFAHPSPMRKKHKEKWLTAILEML